MSSSNSPPMESAFLMDTQGTVLACNECFASRLGHTIADLLGKNIYDFLPPGVADHRRKRVAEVIASGTPMRFEDERLGRTIDQYVCPMFREDKKVSALAILGMDVTGRKAAEHALRQSEERFRAITSHTPDHILMQDLDLRYTLVINPQLGLTPEDMLGKTDHDFLSAEDARKLERIKRSVLETGESVTLREFAASYKGEWGYFDGTYVPTHDESGRINGLAGYFKNVTKQKLAEDKLQESEERLRLAHLAANDVIWDWDVVRDAQTWNPAGASVFGWTDIVTASQTAHWWLDRVHPDDRGRVEAGFFAVVNDSEKAGWQDEYRFRRADGTYAEVLDRGYVLRNREGEALRMIGSMLDITERKRAEESLKASHMFLEEAQDIARLGGWKANPHTDYLEWTDGVRAIIEVPRDYKPGLTEGLAYFLPDYVPSIREKVAECLSTGQPFVMECKVRTTSGRELWAELRGIAPIVGGERTYVVGTFQDINDRKLAEEERETLEAQLVQARKMESIGRLAGGVAHDFNNMLQVIQGNVEMALGGLRTDELLCGELHQISLAAQRAADLTRQLMIFARRQNVTPRLIDLNLTVEEMLRMLRRLIGEGIDLFWEPGPRIPPVKMDPRQMDQVLANLCVNARDAIQGVGRVMIKTEATALDQAQCAGLPECVPGEYVVLTVTDDGAGMDRETLDRVFEPFFTTKGTGKGTGLGLATVYGIVSQGKGFIRAHSEPGKGTSFRIYLPAQEGKADDVQSGAGATSESCGQETILLVEDETAILQLTARMLQDRGYTVLTAASPSEALQQAQAHRGIDLLVTDVIMPEMNGRELARQLMCLHPELKCMFMSGYTANLISREGALEPGVSFLQKPFSLKEMANRIRDVLDGK